MAGGANGTLVYAGTNGTIPEGAIMNRLGTKEVKVSVDEGSLKALFKDPDGPRSTNLGFSDPKVLK